MVQADRERRLAKQRARLAAEAEQAAQAAQVTATAGEEAA
jgi:hypothetical protein